MRRLEAELCQTVEVYQLLKDIRMASHPVDKRISKITRGTMLLKKNPLKAGLNYIELHYKPIGADTAEDPFLVCDVHITTTPCNFGGNRYWFLCPAITDNRPCNKRVGILYGRWGRFACRNCNKITYALRNLPHWVRHLPEVKIVALESHIKRNKRKAYRYTYRKKLTKRRERIDKLYDQIEKATQNIRYQYTHKI